MFLLMLALFLMKSFFLLFLILCLLVSCRFSEEAAIETPTSTATVARMVTYDVTQTITLENKGTQQPEKHNLWVALIGDHWPYQQLLARDIKPDEHVIVSDEYGNQYAEFDFVDLAPGDSVQIKISYEVAVKELIYNLATCVGDLPQTFTMPELHIESNNPQITSLAAELSAADQTACEQVRAFYNYIGNNLVYTFNGANWGAQAALGPMGADCTEFSSLLIALSRAKDIPARYVEGLLYLGESEPVEAHQEHAWVEVYFPGSGWVPIDPTLGRSSLTRSAHFARYSPNHIIVTRGRSPSTLRGASYWSHLYWPGDSTHIGVQDESWTITPQSATNP